MRDDTYSRKAMHVKERFKERYNLDIDREDRRSIQHNLRKFPDGSKKLKIRLIHNSGTRAIYEYPYNNKYIYIVYDTRLRVLVSVLTREQVMPWKDRRYLKMNLLELIDKYISVKQQEKQLEKSRAKLAQEIFEHPEFDPAKFKTGEFANISLGEQYPRMEPVPWGAVLNLPLTPEEFDLCRKSIQISPDIRPKELLELIEKFGGHYNPNREWVTWGMIKVALDLKAFEELTDPNTQAAFWQIVDSDVTGQKFEVELPGAINARLNPHIQPKQILVYKGA